RQQPCFLLLVSLSAVCGGGVSARAHRSPPAPRGADPTPSAGDGPPRLPPFLPVSGIAEGAGRSRRDRPSRARGAFSPSSQVCAPVHRSKGGKESRSPLGRSSKIAGKTGRDPALGCPPGRDPNRSTSIPAPPSGDCGGESGRDKGCNGEESPLPSPQTAPFPGRQRKRPYPAVPHDRPAFAQRERQTRGSSVCRRIPEPAPFDLSTAQPASLPPGTETPSLRPRSSPEPGEESPVAGSALPQAPPGVRKPRRTSAWRTTPFPAPPKKGVLPCWEPTAAGRPLLGTGPLPAPGAKRKVSSPDRQLFSKRKPRPPSPPATLPEPSPHKRGSTRNGR